MTFNAFSQKYLAKKSLILTLEFRINLDFLKKSSMNQKSNTGKIISHARFLSTVIRMTFENQNN